MGNYTSFFEEKAINIFAEEDDLADGDIIDKSVDAAGQKGTGRWTSLEALKLGVNISMITAACNTRVSSNDTGRKAAQEVIAAPSVAAVDKEKFAEDLRTALYTAKIMAYAQGFSLYRKASEEYGWDLNYGAIASIFRAGCIIQAVFLNKITEAYEKNPSMENLVFDEFFLSRVNSGLGSLRKIISLAVLSGIPVPAFVNGLEYIDLLRSPSVGANLIQGLRDYFGAHTFKRIDKEGSFHHDWKQHY